MNCKLKNNSFEYIKWTSDDEAMFAKGKVFCKDALCITYAYAEGIDCFWSISLKDCLYNQVNRCVGVGDYIVKIPLGFTLVPKDEFDEYFEDEKID